MVSKKKKERDCITENFCNLEGWNLVISKGPSDIMDNELS